MATRQRRETQKRISDVALELFLAKGFDGVPVTDIAKAAGVSRKTVFSYFPQKELLLHPHADRMQGEFIRRLADMAPQTGLYDGLRYTTAIIAGDLETREDEILRRGKLLRTEAKVASAFAYHFHICTQALIRSKSISVRPGHPYVRATWGSYMGRLAALLEAWECGDVKIKPRQLIDLALPISLRADFNQIDGMRTGAAVHENLQEV